MTATLDDILIRIKKIEDSLPDLVAQVKLSPNQINIRTLDELAKSFGVIKSGEFRSGNQLEPGKGFSGMRVGFPGFSYGSTIYNLAGVDNDVLQTGIDVSTGTLYAINAVLSGSLTISGASSYLAMGNPPPTSATVGTGIWGDQTGIYLLNTSVQEVALDVATGKVTFGAGAGWLNVDGITLAVGSSASQVSSYKFVRSSDGTYLGALNAFDSSGLSWANISLLTDFVEARDTQISIMVQSLIGRTGTLGLWVNTNGITIYKSAADPAVYKISINDTGADMDTIIKGDNDNDLLHADASTDRIGIGIAAPSAKLHVVGSTLLDGSVILNESGASTADVRMEGDTDADLFSLDASADRIGFGVAAPSYKVDVNGDVNIATGYAYRIAGANPIITTPGGRLTFSTGVPVTTSDVTGAGTIYYTPYVHPHIELWNGSIWLPIIFTEVSLSLSSTNATTVYDVFGYLSSGALAIEMLAWTNDTTRATAITLQDGRYCKSGDKTRLYLGTFRTGSTSPGNGEDSETHRYLFNMYNRVSRRLHKVNSSSHTYTTASWRIWNNANAFESYVDFVVGEAGQSIEYMIWHAESGATGGYVGCQMNSSAAADTYTNTFVATTYQSTSSVAAAALGVNVVYALEYGAASVTYASAKLRATVVV